MTPLDFSVVGNATTLKQIVTDAGFTIQSSWSMGDTLEGLSTAADADVNVVVSSTAFYLAQYLRDTYGIPYVVGIPMGEKGTADWLEALRKGDSSYVTGLTGDEEYVKAQYALADLNAWKTEQAYDDTPCDVLVIGEPVYLRSMKSFLEKEMGVEKVRLLCLCRMPAVALEGHGSGQRRSCHPPGMPQGAEGHCRSDLRKAAAG